MFALRDRCSARAAVALGWLLASAFLIALGGFLLDDEPAELRGAMQANALRAAGYVAGIVGVVLVLCGVAAAIQRRAAPPAIEAVY